MDFILSEKPSARFMIARALGEPSTKKHDGISYNVVTSKEGKIFVGSAVGHLFNLAPKDYKTRSYDSYVWEFEWVADWLLNPKLGYKRKYFECLKYLVQQNDFDRFIIGTDFDIEGLLIGVMTFALLKVDFKKLYWMKMNSLAKYDVESAYNDLAKPDKFWFLAGLARHEIDALYGINLSILFSKIVSKFRKRHKTLSLGRVQTPTLRFVVEREQAIKLFIPEKYYNVRLVIEVADKKYYAIHSNGDIKDKLIAEEIVARCSKEYSDVGIKNENCEVANIDVEFEEKKPYHCFNLSNLEQEAWKYFRFTPDYTDKLAQELYSSGLISYPRTGTTTIKGVPYKIVLNNLKNTEEYGNYAQSILEHDFKPREKGWHDGAHTAVYPTGKEPGKLYDNALKLLEMITRRFLATFYPPMKIKHTKITLFVGADFFNLVGLDVEDHGWNVVYKYYLPKINPVPDVVLGQKIKVIDVELLEKETKPPYRYSYASLVREMEKHSIGTKATRSNICKKLWLRGYIVSEKGKGLVSKPLGEKLIDIAQKFSSTITNVDLTRELENNLEGIEKGSVVKDKVINDAKFVIKKIISDVELNTNVIGPEFVKVIDGG